MTRNSKKTAAKKVPGKPFPKGVSGNPKGRPKLPPEIRNLQSLTKAEYVRLVNECLQYTPDQLDAIIARTDKVSALKAAIASIIREARVQGDDKRIETLLNRAIGRVPQKLEMTGDPNAPISFRDMTQEQRLGEIKKLQERVLSASPSEEKSSDGQECP